jgi:hypothetical protein
MKCLPHPFSNQRGKSSCGISATEPSTTVTVANGSISNVPLMVAITLGPSSSAGLPQHVAVLIQLIHCITSLPIINVKNHLHLHGLWTVAPLRLH